MAMSFHWNQQLKKKKDASETHNISGKIQGAIIVKIIDEIQTKSDCVHKWDHQ